MARLARPQNTLNVPCQYQRLAARTPSDAGVGICVVVITCFYRVHLYTEYIERFEQIWSNCFSILLSSE